MDGNGAETLIVIIKGTWSIEKAEKLTLAETQMPIQYSAVYRGEPSSSSLIYDSDIVPYKPGTDCLLLGHAYAPHRNTIQLEVKFFVGAVGKSVLIFGDRKWEKGLAGKKATEPLNFEKIPLVYERAFGGVDKSSNDPKKHEFCDENPVGVGFRAKHSKLESDGMNLPNLEDPNDLIKKPNSRPKPTGFGMISPAWQPRVSYVGTYDEHWRKNVAPLLPNDFDPRFYCMAPPELTSKSYLQGNEMVLVENASPEGRLRFQLPNVYPHMIMRLDMSNINVPLNLDTIIVEPDDKRVQMVWRGSYNIHQRINEVQWIGVKMDS